MAALAAILLPSPLPAQITFQRTYGGADDDYGESVQQTRDGGYVIAGYTFSFGAGSYDVYLVKTDSSGDTLWTRTFGGMDFDEGCSVQQTADGGYVMAGSTRSFGAGEYDVYLIKTDANGDTLWTRTYGGASNDYGESTCLTADGGYIVAGQTHSFGAGSSDVYLIRADASGDTLWTRTFGGDSSDHGYSVQQTVDGGYIVAGWTVSRGAGGTDAYLVKTDANGDTVWTRAYGGTHKDYGWSVQQTAEEGYVVAGYTSSFSAPWWDVYLIKTDARGDTLWTRTYGGADDDWGNSIQQTADGGYVIASYTTSFGAGGYDVYLIKTAANGDTVWTRSLGGPGDDYGHSVHRTSDNGYVIAGSTTSLGTGFDVYLIKTDSLGNVAVAEPKTSPTRAPALALSCEPNPTTGTTTIRTSYIVGRSGPCPTVPRSSLSIYDAQGRCVRSFSLLSPPSSLTWNGRDDKDEMLPSGTYFLRLNAGSQHATARVVVQR